VAVTYSLSIDGDPIPPWTRRFSDPDAVWRYVDRTMSAYGSRRVYFQRVV